MLKWAKKTFACTMMQALSTFETLHDDGNACTTVFLVACLFMFMAIRVCDRDFNVYTRKTNPFVRVEGTHTF